jgi:DNA-binding MarR family transcriptional regulator
VISADPFPRGEINGDEYRTLLEFRTGLRSFLHWSEEQARNVGLSPAQHQLLLIVRAHPDSRGPTIRDVADQLLLRHHSAVGLADRAEALGLIRWERDGDDHRVVRLLLTARGRNKIESLSALHLEELARLSRPLQRLWAGLKEAKA